MARPCMHDPGWSGTVKMCLDPAFLRKAALEHRRLITGDIERPGPDLAAAIEGRTWFASPHAARTHRGAQRPVVACHVIRVERHCRVSRPEFLRRRGEAYRELDDPFSEGCFFGEP
jgi:hypothetical protein